MSGILSALTSAGNSLQAFDNALSNVQNNIDNASTPNYANQEVTLEPQDFSTQEGLAGGVTTGPTQSTRDEYAEQAVRSQQQQYSGYQQTTNDLNSVQGLFDVTGQTGVPAAVAALFQAFSAWTVAPNDTGPRQQVLDAASTVATQISETATALNGASQSESQQMGNAVASINSITSQIRNLNVQMQNDYTAQNDPGVDAQLHTALDNLSQYTDFTALRQPDGTVTVLMGGQVPLVIGSQQNAISANSSGAQTQILDAQGNDITAQATTGSLGAMVAMRNTTLPGYLSSLNTLAQGLADTVNSTLAGGQDLNGNPGAALFTYNAAEGAAATLAVNPIDPTQLAAASTTAPDGNANALALAALATQTQPQLNGLTFSGYYGQLATQVGQDVTTATNGQNAHQQLLLQAQSFVENTSGVSLDEEAAQLMQFQRSYQATAQLMVVLNDLTLDTLNILQPSLA
jgi:flagellar hook-associated protein 1 FlgK